MIRIEIKVVIDGDLRGLTSCGSCTQSFYSICSENWKLCPSFGCFTCCCCPDRGLRLNISVPTPVILTATRANTRLQNRPEERCKIRPKVLKSRELGVKQQAQKDKSFPVCKDATGGGNRARRISFEVIFRPKSSFAEQTVFHCEYKSQPTTEGGTVLRAQEPTAHVQLASGASKQHGPAGFLSLRLLLHPKYSRVPPRTQTGDQLLIRHNFEDVSGRRALAAGGPDLFRRFYNGVSTDNANKSATQMEINL